MMLEPERGGKTVILQENIVKALELFMFEIYFLEAVRK